jgi:dolichol-phosphate mannosyltransferase
VVVPVYNEASSIERACRVIAAVLGRYQGDCLLIAVDDGSADESADILARLEREIDILHVERHATNAGYGAALRTGASRAHALGLEYVAFIDSDLTNPPDDLLTIGALAAQGHPYIKASRFVDGGSMAHVPALRRLISRSGNLVASTLFGTRVRDVTNGFRAGRTELVCSWPTREHGFAVIVEEFDLALRAGVEPTEFATVLAARADDQRRSAFSVSPQLVLSYARYPMRAFIRRTPILRRYGARNM